MNNLDLSNYVTVDCPYCFGRGCGICCGNGTVKRLHPLCPTNQRPQHYELARTLRRLAATQRNLPLKMTEEEHAALLEAAKILEAK